MSSTPKTQIQQIYVHSMIHIVFTEEEKEMCRD